MDQKIIKRGLTNDRNFISNNQSKKIACSDTILFKNMIALDSGNSTYNAIGTYNYDLSSYLPNDNFNLIGYFHLEYIASSTSAWSECKLKDNATNYTLTLGQVLRDGNFNYQRIFVWFPIPENKIITKIITGANAERCRLFFLGYQKLNSIELV